MRRVLSVLTLVAALLVAVLVSPSAPIVEAKGPPPHAGKPPCRPAKSCETALTSSPTTTTTVASTTTTTVAPTTTTTVAPTTTTTVVSTTSYGQALWHADADADIDSGSNTRFMDKETGSLPADRLSIVDDPLGRYGKVYRAHLTAADVNAGHNRAEWNEALLGDGDTALNLWGEDAPATTDLFIGWRSLFGNDVVVDSSHSNDGNYLQLKGDSSCGGPAIGMTIKSGRLTMRSEQYLTATDGVAWNGPAMSSLLDNRWHDFVMRVGFAKDNTGYLEVWLDGAPQTMVNGLTRIHFPTVCPNDSEVFPKWGVYGMDEGTGAGPAHWLESPRIGTDYTAVVPR